MRAALINLSTGMVENVIVADANMHDAPEGYLLINHHGVAVGDRWDGRRLIFDPKLRFPKLGDAPKTDPRLKVV